ncbi:hypothetical protein BDZ89DRAFT_1055119 [Hymenopellis radicata]|nr:hypothetical protein BDZ89DRAFT_1055119 [Hymenopellis radicata]
MSIWSGGVSGKWHQAGVGYALGNLHVRLQKFCQRLRRCPSRCRKKVVLLLLVRSTVQISHTLDESSEGKIVARIIRAACLHRRPDRSWVNGLGRSMLSFDVNDAYERWSDDGTGDPSSDQTLFGVVTLCSVPPPRSTRPPLPSLRRILPLFSFPLPFGGCVGSVASGRQHPLRLVFSWHWNTRRRALYHGEHIVVAHVVVCHVTCPVLRLLSDHPSPSCQWSQGTCNSLRTTSFRLLLPQQQQRASFCINMDNDSEGEDEDDEDENPPVSFSPSLPLSMVAMPLGCRLRVARHFDDVVDFNCASKTLLAPCIPQTGVVPSASAYYLKYNRRGSIICLGRALANEDDHLGRTLAKEHDHFNGDQHAEDHCRSRGRRLSPPNDQRTWTRNDNSVHNEKVDKDDSKVWKADNDVRQGPHTTARFATSRTTSLSRQATSEDDSKAQNETKMTTRSAAILITVVVLFLRAF